MKVLPPYGNLQVVDYSIVMEFADDGDVFQ
jgi:hypothetical protein